MSPPLTRQDRRRQEREDDKLLRAGLGLGDDGAPVLALARRFARLLSGKGGSRAADAAAEAHDRFEGAMKRHRPDGVACRKGCAWCCSSHVAVTAPEVFLIARSLTGPRREEIAARIRAASAAKLAKPPEERFREPGPCALLEDGACGVYAVRPSSCRSLLSFDADACARVFGRRTEETVPGVASGVILRSRVQAALRAALAVTGRPPVAYELTSALDRVLSTPDAEARWLAGEPVFDGLPTETAAKPDFDANVRALAGALRAGGW